MDFPGSADGDSRKTLSVISICFKHRTKLHAFVLYVYVNNTLKQMDTISEEGIVSKLFCLSCEKGPTRKQGMCSSLGQLKLSFLQLNPFQKISAQESNQEVTKSLSF